VLIPERVAPFHAQYWLGAPLRQRVVVSVPTRHDPGVLHLGSTTSGDEASGPLSADASCSLPGPARWPSDRGAAVEVGLTVSCGPLAGAGCGRTRMARETPC
jgi:hypothetical protein